MYVCYGLLHTYCNKLRGAFFFGKTRTFYSRKEYMKNGGGGNVEKREAKMTPIKILFVSWKIILCRIFLGFIFTTIFTARKDPTHAGSNA